MPKRTWTPDQIDKLYDLWGTKNYKSIAHILGHTELAVKLKAKRLGLGKVKEAQDYICVREISRIMGIDSHKVTDCWIKKLGLPCNRIQGENRTLWILVRHDHLMKFLENNQYIFDSMRIEPYGLG